MYVMTLMNVPQQLVRVYDTEDNSNEVVRLPVLIDKIRQNHVVVKGISFRGGYADSTYLPSYGVYVSYIEAKTAMANLYIQAGMPAREAYRRVGLTLQEGR